MYLDVRTNAEWDKGHVGGAQHFELARLQAGEIPDIPKDFTIQVYCGLGRRAEMAKSILNSAGFLNVTNVGGLENLRAEGVPIESSL